jgi:glucose-1-phosphate cytidylyltransferase
MKVVILAGGFGTRLSEYTNEIPKPMVPIGGKPILEHIMEIYSNFGHNDFYVAAGYKQEAIRDYFKNQKKKWNITIEDTGAGTLTGGRLKKLEKYLKDDTFSLTYGDGVSDLNINKLIDFHKSNKKLATITAVRPPARFGALEINNNVVIKFKEKIQSDENWINGGFFIFEPNIFDFLKDDKTILEKEPLETLSEKRELVAYKHYGFWQCMDHKSDKDNLDKLIELKKASWLKN